jgi:hypothetical protein
MNSQDFHNLQEAYSQVYQLDEKVLGQDPEMRRAGAKERKSGSKRLPPSSGKGYADNQKKSISYMNKLTKNNKIIPGMAHESYDLYDIILSHLLDEGYADTQEAAEAIMVNMSEEWRDDISELYKGKHGQSETEYQAGRSDAGKRVSGDENTGPRHYALGRSARPDAPTKPGEKPKNTPKLANWEKDDIQYRKANLKK